MGRIVPRSLAGRRIGSRTFVGPRPIRHAAVQFGEIESRTVHGRRTDGRFGVDQRNGYRTVRAERVRVGRQIHVVDDRSRDGRLVGRRYAERRRQREVREARVLTFRRGGSGILLRIDFSVCAEYAVLRRISLF